MLKTIADGQPAAWTGAGTAPVQISVRGVEKSFTAGAQPIVALKDIDLDIRKGEFVCLLGPSGCGKSTLLNAVAGFQPPTRGTVNVDGRLITEPGPDRGMVFQEYALFPWMTVAQNVAFGLEIKTMPKAEIAERVEWLLGKLHLQDFRNRYPKDLSGGMRQRVAIARVLALDSPILLMDEPFGALDALTRRTLQDELLRIWEEVGKTILFVTHSIEESIYLADRIIVMTYRPGTIKRDVQVEMPRPRDASAPEFNRLKRELSQMVMEEQQRFSQDEIRSVTAD
ncbi:NitT/TauT family transport system ATP-binding protein [Azospirillum agricola]|uniref:ABC transporter ATP-binding protein n=1 Tax=Azospirillum agricola TaxID=1720247 RepID=UPI001F45B584|nr:ABC transporter ATP-binding protein [Azospirillum agricola]MBP2230448.1 NitT/TauT family transport system ATP-binding protein [Azospirillum agricola]